MNFIEALEHLNNGKRIRASYFPQGVFLELIDNLYYHNSKDITELINDEGIVRALNMVKDWEVEGFIEVKKETKGLSFEEALQHLKQGEIITFDHKDFHYIDKDRVVTFYKYMNKGMIIVSDLQNTLREDWTVLSIEEENSLGIR